MKSFSSKKLAIGATGLVLLGGAGGAVAVAATQGSAGSNRQAYIDDVAKHLSVSPTALTAAMKAARDEQIEAAVAAGRITRSQANALKQRVQQGGGVPFFGHRFDRGGRANGVAAQYLGITPATLRSEIESGKSLAQIASSTPDKSVEGLKAAIISAEKARLERAAAGGLITSQQEQERLSNLSGDVEAQLQRTGLAALMAVQVPGLSGVSPEARAGRMRTGAASAWHRLNLPGIRLEPLLKARAEELSPGCIRFNHEPIELEQDENGVTPEIHDKDANETYKVHSQYLIAADGGRTVAGQVGVDHEGLGVVGQTATIHAAVDLSRWAQDSDVLLRWIWCPPAGTMVVLAPMGPTRWGPGSEE